MPCVALVRPAHDVMAMREGADGTQRESESQAVKVASWPGITESLRDARSDIAVPLMAVKPPAEDSKRKDRAREFLVVTGIAKAPGS
jgi:hypothetical protein